MASGEDSGVDWNKFNPLESDLDGGLTSAEENLISKLMIFIFDSFPLKIDFKLAVLSSSVLESGFLARNIVHQFNFFQVLL